MIWMRGKLAVIVAIAEIQCNVGVAHPQSTEEALEYIVLFVWEKKLYLSKYVMNNSSFFHQISLFNLRIYPLM